MWTLVGHRVQQLRPSSKILCTIETASWPDASREPIATKIIEEHLRGKDLTVEGQKSQDDVFAATVQAMDQEMATEYKYAMAGLTVGFVVALSVIGGSVFLTAKGHPMLLSDC